MLIKHTPDNSIIDPIIHVNLYLTIRGIDCLKVMISLAVSVYVLNSFSDINKSKELVHKYPIIIKGKMKRTIPSVTKNL